MLINHSFNFKAFWLWNAEQSLQNYYRCHFYCVYEKIMFLWWGRKNLDLVIAVFFAGKCRKLGCNRPKAVNPRTQEVHEYCSIRCKHHDEVTSLSEAEQQKGENAQKYKWWLEWGAG